MIKFSFQLPIDDNSENVEDSVIATALIPFAAYDKGLAKTLDDWAYLMSKNITSGALYRDTRKLLDDYFRAIHKELEARRELEGGIL